MDYYDSTEGKPQLFYLRQYEPGKCLKLNSLQNQTQANGV